MANERVTQMLRQSDSQVFRKYSQMRLQMQREARSKLNHHANDMADLVAQPVSECRNSGTVRGRNVTNDGFASRKSFRID